MPAGGLNAGKQTAILTDEHLKSVHRITGANLIVGILALTIGLALGVLQGLEHAGFDFYSYLQPVIKTYYQGLTLHGVLNALVGTTFFICGFFTYAFAHSLNRPFRHLWLQWAAFLVMLACLLLAS